MPAWRQEPALRLDTHSRAIAYREYLTDDVRFIRCLPGAAASVARAEAATPRRRRTMGVVLLVLLLGCGQGETAGPAESDVEPLMTSSAQTLQDDEAGAIGSTDVSVAWRAIRACFG
jgi:hypothetical protein